MTEEKFANEMMTEEQLENVTGGATGYIYFLEDDKNKGSYFALKVTGKLGTQEEVFATYDRTAKADFQNLKDGVDGKFYVPKKDVDMLVKNMLARHYEFVDVTELKAK